MKLLKLNRNRIFRAVRAACLALFFAACAARAQAQSHSAEYTVNGTTVTGVGPSNANTAYFLDTGTQGYNITINPNITLGNNSHVQFGNELQFDHGSLVNNGTLSAYYTAVLTQGATTVTNNGTISSSYDPAIQIGSGTVINTAGSSITQSNSYSAIYVLGNGTVNNSGSIYSQSGFGVQINGIANVTNSGRITTSTGSGYSIKIYGANGTITNTASGYMKSYSGINFQHAGTVNNAGTIIATGGDGIYTQGAGTVNNTGTITANEFGVYLSVGGSGASSVTNSGTITGTSSDGAVELGATGSVTNLAGGQLIATTGTAVTFNGLGTVTNSGYIHGANGEAVTLNAGGSVTNSASGNMQSKYGVFITGNGTVTNSGSMYATGGDTVNITGNGTVTNSNYLASSSSYAVNISGNGTVTNSGYLASFSTTAINIGGVANVTNTANGYIQATETAILISSGNVVNAGTLSVGYNGIETTGAGASTIRNSGAISGAYVGIYGEGTGVVAAVNTGTISATYGVYLNSDNSSFVDAGGTITGGSSTIGLDGNNQFATLQGRPVLNGTMSGYDGTNNTLNFRLAGLTPAQAAALRTTIAATPTDGTGIITFTGTNFFAGKTYHFTEFDLVHDFSLSLEQVVDPGLHDLAVKLDNAPALPPVFDALYASAAIDPEGTLNQFSGREFYQAFASMNLGNTLAIGELADSRAFQLRAGTGGFDLSQLNVVSGSEIASLGETSDLLGKMLGESAFAGTTMSDSKDDKTMTAEPPRWGAWISGTITQAEESNEATDPGYQSTTGSPTIGADYRLCPDLAVGALFNFSTTGLDFDDGSHLGESTYLLGVYGVFTHDHFFANSLIGAGYSAYDNDRIAPAGAGTATSHPQGGEVIANLDTGYDFKLGRHWNLDPEIGFDYTHLTEDGFNENGAGALDLTVADQNVDSLRGKVGFRALGDYTWNGIRFSPDVHADYYHEFMDDNRGVQVGTPGAPAIGSFVVQTNQPERDFALVGAGLAATPAELDSRVTFFVNYDAQVGQSDFMANTYNGGVRVGF